MSSRDGFPRADVDVRLFDDPKMKRLWRLLKDEDKMARATVAYISIILGAWAHAEPTSIDDAAPVWLNVDEEIIDALIGAELIDVETSAILAKSFTSWIVPALDRKERRGEASAVAHEARWGPKRDAKRNATRKRLDAMLMPLPTYLPTGAPDGALAGALPPTGADAPAREEGETLKQFLSRIGAPIPDVAMETKDAPEIKPAGVGDARKPRRRRTKRSETPPA